MLYSTSLKLSYKYIAKDKDGEIYFYKDKPECNCEAELWYCDEGFYDTLGFIIPEFFTQLDWAESLYFINDDLSLSKAK